MSLFVFKLVDLSIFTFFFLRLTQNIIPLTRIVGGTLHLAKTLHSLVDPLRRCAVPNHGREGRCGQWFRKNHLVLPRVTAAHDHRLCGGGAVEEERQRPGPGEG